MLWQKEQHVQRPGGQRARMTIWPEIPGGVGERMKRRRERARKKSGTDGGGRGSQGEQRPGPDPNALRGRFITKF